MKAARCSTACSDACGKCGGVARARGNGQLRLFPEEGAGSVWREHGAKAFKFCDVANTNIHALRVIPHGLHASLICEIVKGGLSKVSPVSSRVHQNDW